MFPKSGVNIFISRENFHVIRKFHYKGVQSPFVREMIFLGYQFSFPFNRMTRGRRDTGTRSGMCPKPSVRCDKPQGSESLIKICDLMAPDWWAVQASPHRCLVRLPFSTSPRLFLTSQPHPNSKNLPL